MTKLNLFQKCKNSMTLNKSISIIININRKIGKIQMIILIVKYKMSDKI